MFQLIPEESAGTDYYTLTWDPTDGVAPQQTISVASFDAETNIIIDLPSGASLVYAGVTYNEGTPLRVTIRRWATFHLIASNGMDFTGACTCAAEGEIVCAALNSSPQHLPAVDVTQT